MAADKITRPQRDKLLAQMTDELAEHVLMDNYRQSMALTHCEVDPAGMLDEAIRFMRDLERAGKLDRQVEFLPDDETLAERRGAGIGLTRPEFAVLLAYANQRDLYHKQSDQPRRAYIHQ
jgi:glutamate dehydrogenase